MAGKKNNEFGLDGFDFDEFNFGNDDFSEMNAEEDKKLKKRQPIADLGKNFVSSVKDQFTSESFLRQMASESLPPGYGKGINTTYEALGTLRDLYDTGVKELQPAGTALRSLTAKLLPSAKKVLPKGLADRMEEFSKESEKYRPPSQSELDEKSIVEQLGQVFKTQAAVDYKEKLQDNVKDDIRDTVTEKRFGMGFKETQAMRMGIQRLVAYQDEITSQYQRKSLELQYRQYFATRDLVEVTRRETTESNALLKAIAHNSALPDVVKTKLREVSGAMFEHRLAAGFQNGVSKYISGFMPNLKKRVLLQGRNFAGGIRDGLTTSADMADMAGSVGMTGAGMTGSVAGSYGADELGYHISNKLRKALGGIPGIRRGGNALDDIFSQLPERANEYAQTPVQNTGIKGFVEGIFKSLIGTYSQDTNAGTSPLSSLDQATHFNNHTQRSITQIIPGYLARILREVTMSRTGDTNTPLLMYNVDRGEFTHDTQVKKDILNRIVHPAQTKAVRDAADGLSKSLDPNSRLTEKQNRLLQEQILRDTNNGLPYDPARYIQDGYRIKGASAEDHNAIVASLSRRYHLHPGMKSVDSKNEVAHENFRKDRQHVERIRNLYPAPADTIRVYGESGYMDQMRELGLVKRNGFNNEIDLDKLMQLVMNREQGVGGGHGGGEFPTGHQPKDPNDPSNKPGGPKYPANWRSMSLAERAQYMAGQLTPKGHHPGDHPAQGGPGSDLPPDGGNSGSGGQYFKDSEAAFNKVQTSAAEARALLNSIQAKQRQTAAASATRANASAAAQAAARRDAAAQELHEGNVSTIARDTHTKETTQEALIEAIKANGTLLEAAIKGTTDEVQTHGRSILESLTTGKLPEESDLHTHLLQQILKAIRRQGGSANGQPLLEGDADFDEYADHGIYGDSPEAKLARKLYKWKRGAGKAGRWAKNKVTDYGKAAWGRAKGIYGGGKSLLGGLWNTGKGIVQELGNKALDEARDLYIKGRGKALLEYEKLMNGEYFDKDGNVLKRWRDIKGDVYNKAGNIVASVKDMKGGLFTIDGKKVLNSLTSKLMNLFGKLAGSFNPVQMLKTAKDAVVGAFNKVKDFVNQPMDIYVRGERNPRMLGILMAGGEYLSKRTGKPVLKPSDLDGVIINSKNEIVIDLPDYEKGLVNVFGLPIGNLGQIVKRLIVGGFVRAKNLVVKGATFVKDTAVKGAKKVKDLFNWGKNALRGKVGFHVGTHSEEAVKQTSILQAILTLLDERLPRRKQQKRLGSFQDEMQRDAEFKEHHGDTMGKKNDDKAQSPFSKFTDWLKSKFGGKKKKGDKDDDGGNNFDIDINGKEVGEAEKGAAKGAGKLGKVAGWIEKKIPGGKYINKAGGLIGKVGKGAWKYGGKALGALSSIPGLSKLAGLFGGGGGGAATAAAATEAAAAGTGLATTAATATGTGLATAGGAAAIEGAAALGGAEALGATLGGGALAAEGGAGLLAILGGPITLAILAAAAVGYVGYKIYRAFKDKMGPLETYRMAQYGIASDKPDQYNKVRKLEMLLAEHVSISGKKASIDMKKIKMEDVASIFGLDKTSKGQMKQLLGWFVQRFKPVFLTHMAVLKSVAPKCTIDRVDDDIPKEKKMEFLDSVTVNDAVYSVGISPFKGWFGFDKIQVGSMVVAEALKVARAALNKDGIKNEDKATIAKRGPYLDGEKKNNVTALNEKGATLAALGPAATAAALKAAQEKNGTLKAVSMDSPLGPLDPSGLTVLDVIRLKAYGLASLVSDRVRLFSSVENWVFKRLTSKADGTTTFAGDPALAFKEFGVLFGIHEGDDARRQAWIDWFSYRMVPVALQYVSAVRSANSAIKIENADRGLSPKQRVDVATAMIAAKTNYKGTMMPVWGIEANPLDKGASVNTASSSTTDNLELLKQAADNQTINDPKAKAKTDAKGGSGSGGTKATPSSVAANKTAKSGGGMAAWNAAATGPGGVSQSKGYQPAGTVGDRSIGYAASIQGGGAMKGGPGMGGPAAQIGAGNGGGMSSMGDGKVTGKGFAGVKDILLNASKVTGVDASTLATFANIESGFKPGAKAGTSSASGLFQFTNGTWNMMIKKYGSQLGIEPGTPSTDPRASALMGAMYIKDNSEYLAKRIGRQPTTAELYMAHFLGPGGAAKLLTADPNTPADQILDRSAINANRSMFAGPGGSVKTVAQFQASIGQLVDKKGGWNVGEGSNDRVVNQDGKAGHQFGGHTDNAAAKDSNADSAQPQVAKGFVPAGPVAKGVANVAGANPTGAAQGPSDTSAAPSPGGAPPAPVGALTGAHSMPMAPTRPTDDSAVESNQKTNRMVGEMSSAMSRRAGDKTADSTEAMTNLLTQQLAVQTSMDTTLKTITGQMDGLLKLSGQQLSKMGGGAFAGVTGDSSTTPAKPDTQTAAMPTMPVNVGRSAPSAVTS